jgi:RNA polymerase sigma factor (sigma-70 family)
LITKYDLRKCKYLKLEMIDLQDQLNELVSMMTSPRISQLTGMPGGGNGGRDNTPNTIAKVDELCSLYNEKFDALVSLQQKIEKAIEPLSAEEQMILRMHYFSNYTWEEVARRMGRSLRTIYRLHEQAKQQIFQDDKRGSDSSIN